jgi:hypothetical protein
MRGDDDTLARDTPGPHAARLVPATVMFVPRGFYATQHAHNPRARVHVRCRQWCACGGDAVECRRSGVAHLAFVLACRHMKTLSVSATGTRHSGHSGGAPSMAKAVWRAAQRQVLAREQQHAARLAQAHHARRGHQRVLVRAGGACCSGGGVGGSCGGGGRRRRRQQRRRRRRWRRGGHSARRGRCRRWCQRRRWRGVRRGMRRGSDGPHRKPRKEICQLRAGRPRDRA